MVYVTTDDANNTVHVINESNAVMATVQLGHADLVPHVSVNPSTNKIYVAL